MIVVARWISIFALLCLAIFSSLDNRGLWLTIETDAPQVFCYFDSGSGFNDDDVVQLTGGLNSNGCRTLQANIGWQSPKRLRLDFRAATEAGVLELRSIRVTFLGFPLLRAKGRSCFEQIAECAGVERVEFDRLNDQVLIRHTKAMFICRLQVKPDEQQLVYYGTNGVYLLLLLLAAGFVLLLRQSSLFEPRMARWWHSRIVQYSIVLFCLVAFIGQAYWYASTARYRLPPDEKTHVARTVLLSKGFAFPYPDNFASLCHGPISATPPLYYLFMGPLVKHIPVQWLSCYTTRPPGLRRLRSANIILAVLTLLLSYSMVRRLTTSVPARILTLVVLGAHSPKDGGV